MIKYMIMAILLMAVLLSASTVDSVIAKVGREVILLSELDQQMMQLNTAGMNTAEISRREVLNQMIESKLIIQKAKDEGYVVDEFKIKEMADEQFRAVTARFPDEKTMFAELKKAGLSPYELKKYFKEKITEKRLRDQIMRQEINSLIHITQAEIEEFYQEKKAELPLRPSLDKLAMLMRQVKVSKTTKSTALAAINKVVDKLREGDDFGELAKIESEGPSAVEGGDIGFFGKGMMVKSFSDAAFALAVGEISKVVESPWGYHVIKLEEKKADEIRVRHILKLAKASDTDKVREVALMDSIKQALNTGAEWDTLARKYSEDDSTKTSGGVIGEFPADDYPEMFKEKLAGLDYGDCTAVINEGDLFYIFKKISKSEERPYEYIEIEDNLHEMVKSNKEIELYEEWVKELYQESYVEIMREDALE